MAHLLHLSEAMALVAMVTLFGIILSTEASPCDGTPERIGVSFTPNKLFSPNYPEQYTNNVTCEWVLEATSSDSQQFVIQVATLEVDFEESFAQRSKCADYLEAFQGFPGNLGESSGVWCKGQKVVKGTGRFLTLRFVANEHYAGKGFILEYSLIKSASSECMPGRVTPVYAGRNPLYEQFSVVASNKSCTWRIEAIDNSGRKDLTSALVIDMYNIPTVSCSYGKFLIYDGIYLYTSSPDTQSPLILAWCDDNSFFSQIYTSSSYATLTYMVEKPAEHTIQLKIYSRETKYPCNGNISYPSIQVNKDPVYFSLPFAKNDKGEPCKVLVTQRVKDYVRIDVKAVEGELTSCDTDAITVLKTSDKKNEEVEHQCFRGQNPMYLPQGSSVIVTSKLDRNKHIYLKAISTDFYCGGFIESRQAYDDHINEERIPYMAVGYEVSNNCISQFVIKPRSDRNRTIAAKVTWSPPLKFFSTHSDSDTCAGDYVNIYDGSSSSDPLLFTTCNKSMAPGFYVNDKVFSTRREMMIQLNTDDILRPAQIKVEFYAVPPASECGNNAMHDAVILVNSTGSELTSPNYRDFYPLDYQCRYRVKAVNKDDIIVIEVLDSNFITGCGDMLSFFNGPEGCLSQDFFGRVCGLDKKDIFVGMSDRAIIKFESDRSGSYGGWMLQIYSREKGFNSADVAAGQMSLLVILAVIGGSYNRVLI